ncbi:MAG: glycoside hydrolase family 97 protein [Candidatus Aminicenantales bacterium]
MIPTHRTKVFGLVFILLLAWAVPSRPAETHELCSPDKKINVVIRTDGAVSYSIFCDGKEILAPSPLSLTIEGAGILGKEAHFSGLKTRSVNEKIVPPVREKRAVISDRYNEAVLNFKGDYGLVFRAYDDGVAYRFFTKLKGRVKVTSEEVGFRFGGDHSVYFPVVDSFLSSFERNYSYLPLSQISDGKMAFLPVLVDIQDGPKVALTEADLDDYPGLYLMGSKDGSSALYGKFAAYPLKEEQTRDRTLAVSERADYIAETAGTREYPWRVSAIARRDGELVENDIVYRLGRPCALDDTSWIKPGKVAWDWWNALNLFGVDFESGVNTKTYKHYIDFAARHGIEYIILDEGWSDPADLLKTNPAIDMPELLAYAREKNVGLVLWCVWLTLDRQLQEALGLFENWGVKGIKVDFMDRDDQKVVNYYKKIAAEAAKRKLVVDFHGAFKPTGLRREYPNILTREGVLGLEYSKWSNQVTPEHALLIPFIRMLAGPMDFTPGAMRNAVESNFKPVFSEPMSQGTRCHQLAMFVVYESPLQMLCDSPSAYLREPEIMGFLGRVPAVWDETKVLDAKIGDYIIVARQSGMDWYVGAMTDWTPRELEIDFGFLGEGEHRADIYADGPNASKCASDYTWTSGVIKAGDRVKIRLAPGGGWAARLAKQGELELD